MAYTNLRSQKSFGLPRKCRPFLEYGSDRLRVLISVVAFFDPSKAFGPNLGFSLICISSSDISMSPSGKRNKYEAYCKSNSTAILNLRLIHLS